MIFVHAFLVLVLAFASGAIAFTLANMEQERKELRCEKYGPILSALVSLFVFSLYSLTFTEKTQFDASLFLMLVMLLLLFAVAVFRFLHPRRVIDHS